MAEQVERYECNCCRVDCRLSSPSFSQWECGTTVNVVDFHVDVQAEVPPEAEAMRWLERTEYLVTVDSTKRYVCGGGDPVGNPGSDWFLLTTETWSDATRVEAWVPDFAADTCGRTFAAAGTGTRSRQERHDACDDPPDYTVDLDRQESAVLSWDATVPDVKQTWTGTEDGAPISSVAYGPPTWGERAGTELVTLDKTGVALIQTIYREWATFAAPGASDYWFGTSDVKWGVAEAAPFTYVAIVPVDDLLTFDEAIYYEMEWDVVFTDSAGSETRTTHAEVWVDGDVEEEYRYSHDYVDFGYFRIENVRWRCSPTAFWHELGEGQVVLDTDPG